MLFRSLLLYGLSVMLDRDGYRRKVLHCDDALITTALYTWLSNIMAYGRATNAVYVMDRHVFRSESAEVLPKDIVRRAGE